MQFAAADLVDLVLRATGDEPVLHRFPFARQTLVVHPAGEACEIDHRLPTSSSSSSPYFALAASIFPGIHSLGHVPELGL